MNDQFIESRFALELLTKQMVTFVSNSRMEPTPKKDGSKHEKQYELISPLTTILKMEFITGVVVKGFGRGGKQLNCPTANLDSKLPKSLKNGIWAGYATLFSVKYPAVISVGKSPFYNDVKERIIEVHLLEYTGVDFYKEKLEVEFKQWMREQREDFESENELRDAIECDKKEAKNILSL